MDFVNPYNFVSLVGDCSRPKPEKSAPTYTGVMECTLETLTPLYIPRGAHDGDTAFFSYDFDSPTPKPVIPGSSIRGVVRSVYEALTNGCLSTADDEQPLYKRTNEPKKPGLLVKTITNGKTSYALYEAERVMLNTRGHRSFGQPVPIATYRTGEKVYIQKTAEKFVTSKGFPTGLYGVVSISKTDPGGWVEGYVLIGEAFQSKHHDSVFIQGNRVANVRDEDYTRLKRVWRLYQTKKNGGVNESRSGGTYPGYLDADSLPVFYKEASAGSGRYYLSPACITKEVFDHTVKGILEKQGGYQPCDKKDDCCEACRLFGMVGDDENSLASRVMFRDALPITDSDWYGSTRRIILGSPKTTATEFYMEDPGFAMFNYDYGVNYTYRHNGSVSGKQLSPITNPRLRGRKFYWHSATQQDAPAGTNVNMTQEIRPVKHGISFTFTVAFDRVTEDELRKLKFALELAFNGESEKYAHKLGHGKPIGYGSVRIRADKVIIYEVCEDLRLTELPAGKIPDLLWRPKETFPVRELKRMLDWENKPENVQYPRTASSPSIYTWFGKNKSIENGSTHPQYTHILPYPLSQNPTLPDTIIRGGGNRNAVRLEKSSWITVSAPATKPAQPSISLDDVRLEFEEDKIIK